MSMKEYAADSGTVLDERSEPQVDQFAVMDLALIVPSATNPRTMFNIPRLQELADSIKASGVHQPVLVRPLPGHRLQETFADRRRGEPRPTHELIAGERRYRASKMAGAATIPVFIKHLTDAQVFEVQLIENLQRDDLHPMEEAEGYEKLCAATGISKKEVGAKIGKSREYVYARIKLLELRPAARKAFYDGEIDSSRALVIARIPDEKLQLKALEEATARDWNDSLRHNFKEFVRWAQQNVMLKLDAARFKITDATLVPDAGSCKDCSQRTGAQPEVFADVESADVCINPTCYHAKEAAHEAIIVAQAEAKGQRIIPEREAKELWKWEHNDIEGYVRADKPDDRVGGSKMLKTILGKDAPEPILLQNPHNNGELIEVYPAEKVSKILKDTGRITPRQARPGRTISATEAKRDAMAKFERTWRKRAIGAVAAAMAETNLGSEISEAVSRLIATELLDGLRGDERQHVCELLGLGKIAERTAIHDYIRTADFLRAEQVMYILLMQQDMLQLMDYGTNTPTAKAATRIEAVAADYQVALEPIRQAVKDELEAALQPKVKAKAPEEATAAPAKAKGGKKSSTPPAAQATRARKPSKEEVARDIAEAFQALEPTAGIDQAPDGAVQEGISQAPVGATEEEGAALAAPASAKDAPQIQVGDRVGIDLPGDPWHEMEGVVTKATSTGMYHVDFGATGTSRFRASSLKVLAAALWPFPNTPAAKPTLDVGTQVKVKETMAGTGGEHAGKEGTVSGQVVGQDRWQVKFPGRGGKAAKIVEFDSDMLQVVA